MKKYVVDVERLNDPKDEEYTDGEYLDMTPEELSALRQLETEDLEDPVEELKSEVMTLSGIVAALAEGAPLSKDQKAAASALRSRLDVNSAEIKLPEVMK